MIGELRYPNIPAELRAAAKEKVRLHAAGKPIPDDVREKANEYQRWCNNKGVRPSARKRPKIKHIDVPPELRAAKAEYQKIYERGGECPSDVRVALNEYNRWVRSGGVQPPPLRSRRASDEDTPYRREYLERNRLARNGVAPGDMPKEVIEGAAKYNGTAIPKYTVCADSPKKGGSCKGRHGNGPQSNKGIPGYGFCRKCSVGYMDIADDVIFCGCCGGRLSRRLRDKGPPKNRK